MNRLLNCLFTVTSLMLATGTASAAWNTISYANEKRYEMIAVVHDGKLVIVNGFDRRVDLVNSVEVYDPESNVWTLKNTTEVGLQNAVTHVGSVLVGDELWLMGGRVGNHPGYVSDKVWIYNIKKNTWKPGPGLPAPFAGGGAALIDNRIHLFGGLDSKAKCDVNHHYVYDVDKSDGWEDLTDTAAMPMPRNHFSTVVHKKKIYVLGGQNNHDRCLKGPTVEVAHAHVFDPQSSKWTRLKDLPFTRSHSEPSSFSYNNKIYIVGGRTNGKKVLSYHPATEKWKVETELELPVSIMAPAARIIGDQLFVAMGGELVHTNASSAMRVLDLPESFLPAIEDEVPVVSNIPTPDAPTAWSDSYSVDGQCYCDSFYDHEIGEIDYLTPVGVKTVRQICADITDKLGTGSELGRVYYNTIQCGHDPINTHEIYDEWVCPGIPAGNGDYTGDRCFETGALWNLDDVYQPHDDESEPDDVPDVTPPQDTTDDPATDDSDTEDSGSDSGSGENSGADNGSVLSVVYRINAGGAAVADSTGSWQSDKSASKYVNTGRKWSHDVDIDQSELDSGVPSELFNSERFDRDGGEEMHWKLPVAAGSYEVRLYFAETYKGSMSTGERVFDVFVEDESLLALDVYSEVGGDTALLKTFDVVSDDTLDIKLMRQIQNPAIKAIEVLKVSGDAPVVSDPENTPSPGDGEPGDDETDVPVEHSEPPTDTDGTSDDAVIFRINAGGPAINTQSGQWQSDKSAQQYVNTGKIWSKAVSVDTSGVSSDVPESLFHTERWDHVSGDSMKWKLPVQPGQYRVNLYFAEIWSGAMKPGGRVFDVNVEGVELLALDVYAEVGSKTALVKSFVVTADSILNIDFAHQLQNPAIKGIEVIALDE